MCRGYSRVAFAACHSLSVCLPISCLCQHLPIKGNKSPQTYFILKKKKKCTTNTQQSKQLHMYYAASKGRWILYGSLLFRICLLHFYHELPMWKQDYRIQRRAALFHFLHIRQTHTLSSSGFYQQMHKPCTGTLDALIQTPQTQLLRHFQTSCQDQSHIHCGNET